MQTLVELLKAEEAKASRDKKRTFADFMEAWLNEHAVLDVFEADAGIGLLFEGDHRCTLASQTVGKVAESAQQEKVHKKEPKHQLDTGRMIPAMLVDTGSAPINRANLGRSKAAKPPLDPAVHGQKVKVR